MFLFNQIRVLGGRTIFIVIYFGILTRITKLTIPRMMHINKDHTPTADDGEVNMARNNIIVLITASHTAKLPEYPASW